MRSGSSASRGSSARTAGGASNTIAPWAFELPRSHVLLLVQVEASFDPQGLPDDPYGTAPDVELARSTYPTPRTSSTDPKEVLADPWVKWILAH